MNLEFFKSKWNGLSLRKKIIYGFIAFILIGALANKDNKKTPDPVAASSVAVAPKQKPEHEVYYEKLSKLFPYDEDVMNNQGTREQMDKARKNEEELKELDAQLIGKSITDWECDTDNTRNQTYSGGSIFNCEADPGWSGGLHSYIWLRVPLTAENAKEIGTSYDKDEFLVSGTITKIGRERQVFAFHNPIKHKVKNDPNAYVFENNLTIIDVSPGSVKLVKK